MAMRGSRSYTIRTDWSVGRKGPTYRKERVVQNWMPVTPVDLNKLLKVLPNCG
jgi:hypothetical protein